MPAPGSMSAITEGLLIERMPCSGHPAGIKDGAGVSPFPQGAYNIVGQRRPGHKYNIRLCVTGGIISEIFEMGLKGCWEDLPNNRSAREHEVSKLSGEFHVVQVTLGRCQEMVGG